MEKLKPNTLPLLSGLALLMLASACTAGVEFNKLPSLADGGETTDTGEDADEDPLPDKLPAIDPLDLASSVAFPLGAAVAGTPASLKVLLRTASGALYKESLAITQIFVSLSPGSRCTIDLGDLSLGSQSGVVELALTPRIRALPCGVRLTNIAHPEEYVDLSGLTFGAGDFDAASSSVSLPVSSVLQGSSTYLEVAAADAYGNLIGSGGLTTSDFSMVTTGGGTATLSQGAVSDLGDGRYRIAIDGTTFGSAVGLEAQHSGVKVGSDSLSLAVTIPPFDLAYDNSVGVLQKIVDISADGAFGVYLDAPSGLQQVYLWDFATSTSTLLSQDSGGTPGNSHSDEPSISADGLYVVFRTYSSNLVSGTPATYVGSSVVRLERSAVDQPFALSSSTYQLHDYYRDKQVNVGQCNPGSYYAYKELYCDGSRYNGYNGNYSHFYHPSYGWAWNLPYYDGSYDGDADGYPDYSGDACAWYVSGEEPSGWSTQGYGLTDWSDYRTGTPYDVNYTTYNAYKYYRQPTVSNTGVIAYQIQDTEPYITWLNDVCGGEGSGWGGSTYASQEVAKWDGSSESVLTSSNFSVQWNTTIQSVSSNPRISADGNDVAYWTLADVSFSSDNSCYYDITRQLQARVNATTVAAYDSRYYYNGWCTGQQIYYQNTLKTPTMSGGKVAFSSSTYKYDSSVGYTGYWRLTTGQNIAGSWGQSGERLKTNPGDTSTYLASTFLHPTEDLILFDWTLGLRPSDTNGVRDIYQAQIDLGGSTLVSASTAGVVGDRESGWPFMYTTVDGTPALEFSSRAGNLTSTTLGDAWRLFRKSLAP
jgi:hypothetical protein